MADLAVDVGGEAADVGEVEDDGGEGGGCEEGIGEGLGGVDVVGYTVLARWWWLVLLCLLPLLGAVFVAALAPILIFILIIVLVRLAGVAAGVAAFHRILLGNLLLCT